MRYEFTFNPEIDGKAVGQFEGYAVLGHQHGESWRIEAIHLDCFPVGTAEVPRSHYLHEPIETWLWSDQRAAIDLAWIFHRAQQKSEAA